LAIRLAKLRRVDNASRKDVTSFPKKHWRQLCSNNSLERLNKEIRRRTDIVGIFPDRPSIVQDTREQSFSVLHWLTLFRDGSAMKSLQMDDSRGRARAAILLFVALAIEPECRRRWFSQTSRKATPGLKKPVRCFVLGSAPLQRRPDAAVID
jgi:hypothetical protein